MTTIHNDNIYVPILINKKELKKTLSETVHFLKDCENIESEQYANGVYAPTPTIIEAAISLFQNHTVENITRNDSGAKNLTRTTAAISDIIELAQRESKKIICFVTGVPGAGKTLVGLKVATMHLEKEKDTKSVYLSGNAPLVAILQEALARDKVKREKEKKNSLTKKEAIQSVKSFIQIIHHYRDHYLTNHNAPYDNVAIFDEAQRAWNKEQTISFMRRKKNVIDFDSSEPEFLISCLDRHKNWAVVICLVGGGQEINTGEAGISEWLNAIETKFVNWQAYISPNLIDKEYSAADSINSLEAKNRVAYNEDLHLSVSLRSFRAENLSSFVKSMLDLDVEESKRILSKINSKYPIVLTRDLNKAKKWLIDHARGSERYGMVASSEALRLKPLAIDVKSTLNPVYWFLNGKEDVRSSYYLEDVVTEFDIQGLELDWACVVWDGDLRYTKDKWDTWSFVGTKWHRIKKEERQKYLINAYRVLLTRARQGMVIVVPEGNNEDHTRKNEYYDSTHNYLFELGIKTI